MNKIKILVLFSLLTFGALFSGYSYPNIVCNTSNLVEVKLILETDTVRHGKLNLQEFFKNYFSVTNLRDEIFCFNEIPVFKEFDATDDNDLSNSIFYFPRIEHLNELSNKWELLDYYNMIGDSGEPLPIVGDSTVCLEKKEGHKFMGMLLLKVLQFSDKGKYRIHLEVFCMFNKKLIKTCSNYSYLYAL